MSFKIPVACLLIALAVGCATTQGATVAAASETAGTPASVADLATFTAQDAVFFRDGGSIEVKGRTSGGTALNLWYDGKMDSDTKGQVFLSHGGRLLSHQECDTLIQALNKQLADPDLKVDRPTLETFVDHLLAFKDKKR